MTDKPQATNTQWDEYPIDIFYYNWYNCFCYCQPILAWRYCYVFHAKAEIIEIGLQAQAIDT